MDDPDRAVQELASSGQSKKVDYGLGYSVDEMSSISTRDLQVAEMLKAGTTYDDIVAFNKKRGTAISRNTISSIKSMMDEGTIGFSEEDKAFEAKPRELAEIHEKVVHVITVKAAEEAVKYAYEDYEMGREIRQYWFLKAQEKGLTLREYVKRSLMNYDEFGHLEVEIEDLRKIARNAVEALAVNTIRRKKLDLYFNFIRHVLTLKAQGYRIPEQVVTDFYADLDYLSQGGEYPMRAS